MAASTYFCALCGNQATKKQVMATKDADATLGTWHCAKPCTSKPVKVKRQKNRG